MTTASVPPASAPQLLAFDGFTLDLTRGVLTASAHEVVLRPKTVAVLAHLLAHAGQVVSREALLTAVWGDIAVTDDSLTQCVSEIRRALGADGTALLQTLPRRGYLLATRLRPVAPDAPQPDAATRPGAGPAVPPGHQPRSPVAWAALAVGGIGLALSVGAWIRPDRAAAPAPPVAVFGTAPGVAAGPEPSNRAQARQLLQDGRIAQQATGQYEARMRASLPMFLRALALDPSLTEAAAEAVFVYANLRSARVSQDPEQDLREAERLAALAMAASPTAPISLAAQAAVLRQQRRFAEAMVFYQRAGADPARVADRANVGVMHLLLGDPDAAQPPLRAALLEGPLHQFAGNWRVFLGLARLLAGQPDQAAGDFLASSATGFPTEDRMLYRLVALHAAGRQSEAAALDADLRQQFAAPLARPLLVPMSDEARYRALVETAILAPLRQMGWIEANR